MSCRTQGTFVRLFVRPFVRSSPPSMGPSGLKSSLSGLKSSHLVPPTKGLRHHGQEDDPLPLAGLSSLLHLAFEGVIQGVSCSCSSLDHSSPFAGVDNSNVQGHIF